MKIKSKIKAKGDVTITISDPETGKVWDIIKSENLVVNSGLQLFLDIMAEDIAGEDAQTGATYMWVGLGTTAPTVSDSDLATYQSEMVLDSYVRTGQEGTYSVQFTTGDSNHLWAEIGLANGTHSSGTMITRDVFSSFTKTSSIAVRVDYKITLQNV